MNLPRHVEKKFNIVPEHKKGHKKIIVNYRPICLIPIIRKIVERILSNSIFQFLNENNLLCENQSGDRPSA